MIDNCNFAAIILKTMYIFPKLFMNVEQRLGQVCGDSASITVMYGRHLREDNTDDGARLRLNHNTGRLSSRLFHRVQAR